VGERIFPHDFAGSSVPNDDVTRLISGGQVKSVRGNRDSSDTGFMEFKINRDLCRERLEVFG
jgi:hypothetical protein